MIYYIYILYLFFVAIQSLFTKILNTMLEFFMQLYVWSPKMYPFRLFATKVTEEDMTFVPTGKFEAANGDADTWGPARLSHNNDQWKQENLDKILYIPGILRVSRCGGIFVGCSWSVVLQSSRSYESKGVPCRLKFNFVVAHEEPCALICFYHTASI